MGSCLGKDEVGPDVGSPKFGDVGFCLLTGRDPKEEVVAYVSERLPFWKRSERRPLEKARVL